MTTRISNNAAITALDNLLDLIDGGASAGNVEIRSGAAPTACEDVDSGTLLADITLNDPAFAGATDQNPGAQAAADVTPAIEDASADAAGTAGHFRCKDSNGVVIIQGNVTATGGGGDMEINSTSITLGATVGITSWTVMQPEL